MLAAIAAHYGVRHVETLTGFKWLARADTDLPGHTLVYAYEEAIGHCVDPSAVRDKDGISAAVLACDLVATLKDQGTSVPQALNGLARRHGVHLTSGLTAHVGDATTVMTRLRKALPGRFGEVDVTVTDLATGPHPTDALVFVGRQDDQAVRVAVRPSGTEPKIKCYIEIRVAPTADITAARLLAEARLRAVATDTQALLTQRGR
jgi:phosphomannomutase